MSTQKPRRSRPADRKRQLVDHAAALFLDRGYPHVSVADIAQQFTQGNIETSNNPLDIAIKASATRAQRKRDGRHAAWPGRNGSRIGRQ